jgi:hypothetical protein
MGAQTIDYELVIRDIERRRADFNARFDAAIAAIRQIQALQSNGLSSTVSPALPFSPESRPQPYRNMSMVDAAIQHIKGMGHPVRNPDLAKALEAGGFPHRSKNFPNTLNSILWRRARTVGDLKKISEGWAYAGT